MVSSVGLAVAWACCVFSWLGYLLGLVWLAVFSWLVSSVGLAVAWAWVVFSCCGRPGLFVGC